MKKYLARTAVFALFAGLAASSYALPASAAVTDSYTAYDGAATNAVVEPVDYIIELAWSDYYIRLEWSGVEAAGVNGSGTLAGALTDKAFDQ